MIKRLYCAVAGHLPDLVNWTMATSRSMPMQRSEVLRKCRRCGVFVTAL